MPVTSLLSAVAVAVGQRWTGVTIGRVLHAQEIAEWMAAPGNEDEFVTLFFDDQSDLGDWVRASCLNAKGLICIILASSSAG